MSRVPTACKDCGEAALLRWGRCVLCEAAFQKRRNARPSRRAYRDRRYRAQPNYGLCWICGLTGADTRDHLVPLKLQDGSNYMTRPAHRACNSGRRSWPADLAAS